MNWDMLCSGLAVGAVVLGASGVQEAVGQCSPRLVGVAGAAAGTGPVPALPGAVTVITSYDDQQGGGPAFYAAGSFPLLGGVVRLNPGAGAWEQPGSGVPNGAAELAVVDDGTGPGGGPALYAGGAFVGRLMRWTGQVWEAVDPAPPQGVLAVVGLDSDGPGGAPAGLHIVVGNLATAILMRLEQGAWETVGHLSGMGRWTERVHAYDEDGAGPMPPAIFFSSGVSQAVASGGTSVGVMSGIVKWDGTRFTALPQVGFGNWIKAAEVFDDGSGSGPALFVSGHDGGAQSMGVVVKWDGVNQRWLRVGPQVTSSDTAYALAGMDGQDDAPPQLVAVSSSQGLSLTSPRSSAAWWNGESWGRAVGTLSGIPAASAYHFPSAAGFIGTGRVPAVITVILPGSASSAATVATIVGCPRCEADVDFSGTAELGDLFGYLEAYFGRLPVADLDGSGTVTVQDLLDFVSAFVQGCG